MLNQIVLMGRLTRDPELRKTQSGVSVVSFTLAVDRDYTGEGGERETDFIDVVAWRNTAEFVSRYFTKGQPAAVAGRLQIRGWTDRDGGKRRSAEVVAEQVWFAGERPKPAAAGGGMSPTALSGSGAPMRGQAPAEDFAEEEPPMAWMLGGGGL